MSGHDVWTNKGIFLLNAVGSKNHDKQLNNGVQAAY